MLPYQASMLAAAQIFGYATNLYAERKATKLDQAAIGVQLKQQTLQLTQQSVQASEQLESVLASQRAIMAARGQVPGQGTARTLANKAIHAYSKEQANQALAKEYNVYAAKSKQLLLGARQYESTAIKSQKLAGDLFNNTSLNQWFTK